MALDLGCFSVRPDITATPIMAIGFMEEITAGAMLTDAAISKEFAIMAVGTKPAFVADALHGSIDKNLMVV